MAKSTDDVQVEELARRVVSQVAPAELPMFAVLAKATLADPDRMTEERADVRERLGFGIGEATVLITPFAILAAREVVQYVTKGALDAGKAAATRLLRRRTKSSGGAASRDLPADQLEELRGIVLEKALQYGLTQPQAELLADAFAGSAGRG